MKIKETFGKFQETPTSIFRGGSVCLLLLFFLKKIVLFLV